VDVWLLDTSQCSRIPETEFECFSEWEIARWARFIFESEANRFAAGQLHLRVLLSRYTGGDPLQIRLHGFSPGRLAVYGFPEIGIAASYAGPYALFVITWERQAGAGIQRLNVSEEPSLIAETFFSQSECRTLKQMTAAAQAKAFCHCWSRRTALLQALRNYPLASLELPNLLAEAPFSAMISSKSTGTAWTLADLPPARDCVASLAVEGVVTKLSTWLVLDQFNTEQSAVLTRSLQSKSAGT
jgi:phosphopantetheinyl transferase